MWLIAIGSIPLLVISMDVLTNRRNANWLRGIIFRPEDTQIYETRDVIYAWAILIFSVILVLWGLKELFLPAKVIEGRGEGLAIRLRGPFRPVDVIPWTQIRDVTAGEMEDEGDALAILKVKLAGRGDLPEHPWAARWVEESVLGILAEDWSQDPSAVASSIVKYVEATAREETPETAEAVWEPEQ
jgi:hypothetical protein